MLKTVKDACAVDPIVFDYKESGGIEPLVISTVPRLTFGDGFSHK